MKDCVRCHGQLKPAFSRFSEKQLQHVMQRMTPNNYWIGTSPVTIQIRPNQVANWGREG